MAKTPIGEQIAQYRKAVGITQEELGRAVGVSTQAVSRWECGGTPDVELLPALADALGVSVDALFGRDGSERLNLDQLLVRAIRQTPEDRRMDRICDLIWLLQRAAFSAAIKEKGIDTMDDLLSGVECSDRSKAPHPGHTPWQFVMGDDSGFLLSGIARDMRYALVLPEAPDGFAAMLKKPEDYLRLFELLSTPHCLDMLIDLCRRKPRETFTDRLAAARTGLSLEEARALLDRLSDHCLLKRLNVADETGSLCVYCMDRSGLFVVFLFFCGQMMRSVNEPWVEMDSREKPGLNAVPGTGNLTPDWITRQSEDETEKMQSKREVRAALQMNDDPF